MEKCALDKLREKERILVKTLAETQQTLDRVRKTIRLLESNLLPHKDKVILDKNRNPRCREFSNPID